MLSVMETKASPPHVVFYEDAVPDVEESAKVGHSIMKQVFMIRVKQVGSKDFIEKNAEEWLEHQARIKQFPQEWIMRFEQMFAAFKAGQEPVPHGTSVKHWVTPNKAEVQTLINAGILTVEDLATANESAMMRVGMGGRKLQNAARAYLQTAAQTGVQSTELATLRDDLTLQKEENKELREKLAEMSAQIGALMRKKKNSDDDFLSASAA